MPCSPYLELLSARLDGELTEAEHRTLTAHLDTCPQCRAIARDLEQLHTAVRAMEVPAPEGLAVGVVQQLRQRRVARRRTLRQLTALAACLLLMVGVVRVADAVHSDRIRQQESVSPLSARTVDEPMPAAAGEPDHYGFSDPQTTPVTYGSTPVAPAAVILGSTDSLVSYLAQFPDDDLSALTEVYDADFFRSHRLLAVLVEANSGSITYTLAPEGLTRDSVAVQRFTPEAGTCDMAAWLLTAQVDTAFADGDVLAVESIQ